MTGRPWTLEQPVAVLGSGLAFPGHPLSTDELLALVEQRHGFGRSREAACMARRLGIASRHVCRDFIDREESARGGEANPDLAARAVQAALGDAGLVAEDLSYLIGHTATPQQALPPNVAFVADRLDFRGPFVELRQACTGFANALMIASGLLASGSGPVAIVGSETGSLFFDPGDTDAKNDQIVNLVQMGDGAAAVILGSAVAQKPAIVAGWYGSTGVGRPPGIQLENGARSFAHDFAAIAAHGGDLFDAGNQVLAGLGYPLGAIDRIVPHQVSGRIGTQFARHFAVSPERVFCNAMRLGNTGSAAIWIALAELRSGGLAAGETVAALGAEASKYMHGGFVYRHG